MKVQNILLFFYIFFLNCLSVFFRIFVTSMSECQIDVNHLPSICLLFLTCFWRQLLTSIWRYINIKCPLAYVLLVIIDSFIILTIIQLSRVCSHEWCELSHILSWLSFSVWSLNGILMPGVHYINMVSSADSAKRLVQDGFLYQSWWSIPCVITYTWSVFSKATLDLFLGHFTNVWLHELDLCHLHQSAENSIWTSLKQLGRDYNIHTCYLHVVQVIISFSATLIYTFLEWLLVGDLITLSLFCWIRYIYLLSIHMQTLPSIFVNMWVSAVCYVIVKHNL